MVNPCFKRWLWFVALYLGGILAVSLLAVVIKWALG